MNLIKLKKYKRKTILQVIVYVGTVVLCLISCVLLTRFMETDKDERGPAGPVKVIKNDAKSQPDKFYLSDDEWNDLEKEYGSDNAEDVRGATTRISKQKIQDKAQINNKAYFVGQNSKKGYEITMKSRDGLQRFRMDPDTLSLRLYEKKKIDKEFVEVVSGYPEYQYKNSDIGWINYQIGRFEKLEIVEQNNQYIELVQQFQLLEFGSVQKPVPDPQDPNPEKTRNLLGANDKKISASIRVKLGFDGKNYINKIDFILDDNDQTNRLKWNIDSKHSRLNDDFERLPKELDIEDEAKIELDNLQVDWSDFGKENTVIEVEEHSQKSDELNVIFYDQGIQGSFEIDPSLLLLTTSSTVQVDVANRYRAIMNTGDTDDFLEFYDRAENDSSPDKVAEIHSLRLVEENTNYALQWDENRITTIIESTPTRVKLRAQGCLDTTTGGACLQDSGSDDVLEAANTYTFTPDGVYIDVDADFKDGLVLDSTDYNDRIRTLQININLSSTHSTTLIYGDGTTEGTATPGNDLDPNDDNYHVVQATGNYQDLIVGEMDVNGDKMLSNSINGNDWYGGSGPYYIYQQDIEDQTIKGKGDAQFFLQFQDQSALDTEAERESLYNSLINPDSLNYQTGEKWDDYPPSPGLDFDGIDDLVDFGDIDSPSSNSQVTIEAWVRWDSLSGHQAVFADGGYVRGMEFGIYNSELHLSVENNNSHRSLGYSTSNLSTDKWYHIVGIADGANGAMYIYVNGDLVAFDDSLSTFTDYDGTNGTILGSVGTQSPSSDEDLGSNSYFLDGTIDEVRVWSEVRSKTQINKYMNRQLDVSDSEHTNLIANWRLNENTGTNTYDQTSNNHDGTFTSSPLWFSGYVADSYNEAENSYTIDATRQSNFEDAFRVTEYYLTTGDFTGATYDLTLDYPLSENYFVLIRGSKVGDGGSNADNDHARVYEVPGGKGELADSGANNIIALSRYVADYDWEGVVTVVECLGDVGGKGFKLVDIVQTSLSSSSTSGTDTSNNTWNSENRIVLFGGFHGGGAEFETAATSTDGNAVQTRLWPSGSSTLNWTRDSSTSLLSATMTTFIVEWGQDWTVQRANVSGSNYGDGCDATGEYNVGSSRVDLQACKLEYSIVSPK